MKWINEKRIWFAQFVCFFSEHFCCGSFCLVAVSVFVCSFVGLMRHDSALATIPHLNIIRSYREIATGEGREKENLIKIVISACIAAKGRSGWIEHDKATKTPPTCTRTYSIYDYFSRPPPPFLSLIRRQQQPKLLKCNVTVDDKDRSIVLAACGEAAGCTGVMVGQHNQFELKKKIFSICWEKPAIGERINIAVENQNTFAVGLNRLLAALCLGPWVKFKLQYPK